MQNVICNDMKLAQKFNFRNFYSDNDCLLKKKIKNHPIRQVYIYIYIHRNNDIYLYNI